MGYKKYFHQCIKKHYPGKAALVIAGTENWYKIISEDTRFALASSNPVDKRLDFTAYFLALIKVLESEGEQFDQIKKVCLEITHEYVRPKSKFRSWLKRLPAKLIHLRWTYPFLKMMDKKISKKGHPDGFLARIITDKKETYGFGYGIDILECGICKLFQKHDASKYASILCEVDKVTSGLAGLELIRTGTIANGAEKCDFRFRKV